MLLEAMAALGAIATAPVHLHGGLVVDDPIVAITDQGIGVGDVNAASWISWDRVRDVTGERAGDAGAYLSMADGLWRARIRLARGDVVLAEGVFDELFERYEGTSGATALVVCEGRLRCALHQGAQASALAPWLEVVRLRLEGERLAGEPPLPSILDERTSLLPALPPFFLGLDTPSARDVLSGAMARDSLDGVLARLYLAVIGGEGVEIDQRWVEHPGVALLVECFEVLHTSGAQRGRARQSLAQRIEGNPDTWIEAWGRVAMGESLIREGMDEQNEELVIRGVLELLHLPSRFDRTQLYLSGYAMVRASEALEHTGDSRASETLSSVLLEEHPLHPASEWIRTRTTHDSSRGEDGT
ncbi:MAG: hypothetical protein ACYTF7_11390 [Planctomycetota bacterium]|jgi:hypothetical protein